MFETFNKYLNRKDAEREAGLDEGAL